MGLCVPGAVLGATITGRLQGENYVAAMSPTLAETITGVPEPAGLTFLGAVLFGLSALFRRSAASAELTPMFACVDRIK